MSVSIHKDIKPRTNIEKKNALDPKSSPKTNSKSKSSCSSKPSSASSKTPCTTTDTSTQQASTACSPPPGRPATGPWTPSGDSTSVSCSSYPRRRHYSSHRCRSAGGNSSGWRKSSHEESLRPRRDRLDDFLVLLHNGTYRKPPHV